MGAQKGWTVWRGKHLIRARIWNHLDDIGAAHRARFPKLAETGDLGDRLVALLAVLAEDFAEEGPTAGELGFLMDRALGCATAPEVIAAVLSSQQGRVWRTEMGRENYYVLEPAGLSYAEELALGTVAEAAVEDVTVEGPTVWTAAPHSRVRLAG